MHPVHLSISLFTPIIIIFFFSGNVTASSSTNETFSNCNRTFTCGSFHNITYPFTGGERPEYCGLPKFNLSCRNEFPELTIGSLSYRVLQINQTQQTLRLARLDLWNDTCPQEFINSTLDSTPFNFGIDNEALTLSYYCIPLLDFSNLTRYNRFSCNVSGNSSYAYYLIGPVPVDPVFRVISCNVSVSVPILMTAATSLACNLTSLDEALMGGFNVNYSIPYNANCSRCLKSGGQCGYDSISSKFGCFCGDMLCAESNTSKKPLVIGIAIGGAGIVGVFLGFFVFYIRQRRKKIASLSKSKDLPTTPSSKSLIPTTTTNLSQSNPSYESSRSDLEKGSTYFGVQLFSYAELEEATNNFDPSKELGEGGFGTVYYGKLHDGRIVAVKRLYENNFKRVEQFMNEVEILTRLRHQNLVMLYGCTSRRSRELILVYEYIPNGTVADHLHGKKANSGLLTWPIRLSIAIETADALAYLHATDIIHRDVKTNNILLDNDFRVKVADFGLVRLFPNDVTHVSTAPQGTPGYVDPEYYQCYKLTDKSDVYSFGVVLIELISSKEAVDTNRHRHDINLANMAINKIQNQTLNELVDPCLGFETDSAVRRMTTSVAELAFRCLQQERDMRPSMEEVLRILRGIENEECSAQKPEVVDIRSDDIGLLKSLPPPISPDSIVPDKWIPNSF